MDIGQVSALFKPRKKEKKNKYTRNSFYKTNLWEKKHKSNAKNDNLLY